MAIDWSVGADLMIAQFGEAITYTPFGGAAVSMEGIVDRQPRATLRAAGRVMRPRFEVHVLNDATQGVDINTIDRAQDLIAFPEVDGGTAETWSISNVRTMDKGMIVLECN